MDVGRRSFLKNCAALVPAAVFGTSFGSRLASEPPKPQRRGASTAGKELPMARWACIIDVIFQGNNEWAYLARICSTGREIFYIGDPNLPTGNCAQPQPPGCFDLDAELLDKVEDLYFAGTVSRQSKARWLKLKVAMMSRGA